MDLPKILDKVEVRCSIFDISTLADYSLTLIDQSLWSINQVLTRLHHDIEGLIAHPVLYSSLS